MNITKLVFIFIVFLAGIVTGALVSTVASAIESKNIKMLEDIMNNPLTILVIGAVVTGILIPVFANEMQARKEKFANEMQARKEKFEIKKELIKKINSSTTKLLGTTLMLARQEIDEKEIPPEFLKWKESCAEIGATVRGYWNYGEEKSVVEKEWNEYYERVEDLYNVITNFSKEEEYSDFEKNLKGFFNSHDPKIELEYEMKEINPKVEKFFETVVKRANSKGNAKEYSEALFKLVNMFDKRKYYLLKLIFRNPIRNQ